MRLKLVEVIAVVVFVALIVGWRERPPECDRLRAEPARWPEREQALERRRGPMDFLGRVQLGWGGFDVYEQADGGRWWAVGYDGRFVSSKPGQEIMAVTDAMLIWYEERMIAAERAGRAVDEHDGSVVVEIALVKER